MRTQSVVLCIQDTTELDFDGQEIAGLGPLNYEARRGMYLHPTYAVTTEREPLGVLDAWMWAREKRDADGVRPGHKESTRWVEGYERVAEMASDMPETRLVYLADREADMVEMMRRAHELGRRPTGWCAPSTIVVCPVIKAPGCGQRPRPTRHWAKSNLRWERANIDHRARCASSCGRAGWRLAMANAAD